MKLQYCKSFKVKLQFILTIIQCNDYNGQSLQVSSVRFDKKKFLRKSFHNETNLNKCEFTEKFLEFINLIINSVQDSLLKSTKLCWI